MEISRDLIKKILCHSGGMTSEKFDTSMGSTKSKRGVWSDTNYDAILTALKRDSEKLFGRKFDEFKIDAHSMKRSLESMMVRGGKSEIIIGTAPRKRNSFTNACK